MVTKKMSAAPFAAIAIFLGAIMPFMFAIAIFMDGYWTFDVNTLSDLGVSYDSTVANLFNYTCIIGGIFIAIYGCGKVFLKEDLDCVSGFLLAISGLLLIGIGIFTKDYDIHVYLAMTYFMLASVALIVSMVSDSKHGRMVTAAISAILVVIVIASFPGFDMAGVEVITTVAFCVWMIAQGFSLVFSKN